MGSCIGGASPLGEMPSPIHPSCCAVTARLTDTFGPISPLTLPALHSSWNPPGSCKHDPNDLLPPVGSCSRQVESWRGMPVPGSAGMEMSEGEREEREARVLVGQPLSAVKG